MAPAEPITVIATRNGVYESSHRVHAVAVRSGRVIASFGDAAHRCFMRSASKPLQALLLVRSREDVTDTDIAIACASHSGSKVQIDAVEALLAKAMATVDDLELGPEPGRDGKLLNNCSGKHAAMLAVCRARGWSTRGYRSPNHPLQEACLDAHCEVADLPRQAIVQGVDGCGVPTFCLTLEQMARAYARFVSLTDGARVARAMRRHPELIGELDSEDRVLMEITPDWYAKVGAEGLLCAGTFDGLGVALKSEDGAFRPLGLATAHLLESIGLTLDKFATAERRNTLDEVVGDLRVIADSIEARQPPTLVGHAEGNAHVQAAAK